MGSSLPYPWSVYAALQCKAGTFRRADDAAWGTDDGLAHILTAIETGTIPANPNDLRRDLKTVVATGAWNNRNRARLRVKYSKDLGDEAAVDPQLTIIARERLCQLQGQLTEVDWLILRSISEGFSYAEIAASTTLSVASLRTRISRLRMRLLN
jgi:DNA-binding NarL/FixJ family response regulator